MDGVSCGLEWSGAYAGPFRIRQTECDVSLNTEAWVGTLCAMDV
jgi:hypothetical protein